MADPIVLIAAETAFLHGQLHLHQKSMDKAINKSVNRLAENLLKTAEEDAEFLSSTIKRKEQIIKSLQASWRKAFDEKQMLMNKLEKLKLAGMNGKLGVDTLRIENDKLRENNDKLREENEKLKAKYKAKRRIIRQYKLLFDEIEAEKYDEDPNEEDGTPSEDSAGVEDISMIDKEALMNDEDSDETDPEDSEFELDENDKAKMMKDEKERNEAAKEEEKERDEDEEIERAEKKEESVLEKE